MSKVLILGVGGAGCELARCFLHTRVDIANVNTDREALAGAARAHARSLLIGPVTCRGRSAVIPGRGRRAAEESTSELVSLTADYDALVLLAGLGGGTGTGAIPVIARLAINRGQEVWVAVTLPFSFEEHRRRIALQAWASINAVVPGFFHDLASTSEAGGASMLSVLERASCDVHNATIQWLIRTDLNE